MAREVIVRMTDDFDRSEEADESVDIGWDGYVYTLDLTTKRADELRSILDPYLSAAHEKVKWPKANRPQKSDVPPTNHTVADKETRREIRDWARQNGHDVKARGIISAEVIQAFADAQRRGKRA